MTLTSVYQCAADLQRVLLTVVSLKYTWFALASKSGHLTAVNLRNGVGRLVCKFDALRDIWSVFFFSQWSRFCVKALFLYHNQVSVATSLLQYLATHIYSLYFCILFLSYIMQTRPCNLHHLTPHFDIVILGYTGVYISSYFCSKT